MNIRPFSDFFKVETATKERGVLGDISRKNLNVVPHGFTTKTRASWISPFIIMDFPKEYKGSFYCVPSAALIDFIEANMITVDYDTIHFSLMYHDDYVVLRACYGQIIGSCVVAHIDGGTIPQIT